MSDVVVLTGNLLYSSAMRASRPHTSSGPHPSEHPPTRPSRRHALPARPSTSSGIPDQTNPQLVPIVVTSPFAGVSPVPPFADFMPTRRRSANKRKEGAPPSRPHAVAATSARVDLPKKDAHFSTADRAILHELKLGAAARESQFKMKGNKKHHPYTAKEAPYPLNYERPVIDHDVWETMFIKQLSGSHTFHVFDVPPTKVLDLGCGSGYWILECAKQWRVSYPSTLIAAGAQSKLAIVTVGSPELRVRLDLVPLHPDLSLLRSSDLGSRITWLQANCLEGLPFPNEEFDFVHIKRLAHGIPEDKWDGLLEEILRVMKPGAAIEMVEEDLFFPGRFLDPPPPHRSPTTPRPSFTTPLPIHHQHNGLHRDTNGQWNLSQHGSTLTSTSAFYNPSMFSPSLPSVFGTASMSTLPVSFHDTDTMSSLDIPNHLLSDSSRQESTAPLNPRDHSLLEYIYTEMHAARFINLSPLSQLAHSLPLYFINVRSHAPIMFMFPPPDLARVRWQLSQPIGETSHSDGELRSAQPSHKYADKTGPVTVIGGRHILHQAQQYVVLDESAVAPGTKTARQKATPTTTTSHLPASPGTPTKSSFPSTSPRVSSEASLFSEEGSTSTTTTAYSHAVGEETNMASWFNTLPNQRLKFDLQNLNLHLSMRIMEILACTEAMWEWVCEYQDTRRQPQTYKGSSQSRGDADRFRTELVGMSRSEFDVLSTRFEFDMHDCINMNSRTTSAFHTPIPTFARTSDRKAFDDACEKWDEYQMKQRARRMPPRPAGVQPKKGSSDLSESLDPDDLEAAGPTRQRLSRTFRVFCAWKAS
ncbi:hypothetical protein EDB86DRAFT_3080919 [Lactarius hatsudake]|nr:hypothetical protein EDB86DRAFT_3080919 [Lactarius hatsudake]